MSGHWWCQHCNQKLSSHEVTFEENHSACGGTAIWIEEEDIGELEFLKRQLSEAGKKVDELYQENLTLKADMVSNKQECCACQKERNELQAQVKERELTIEKVEVKCCQYHAGHVAQVAVLRGALFRVRDEIDKYGSQANLAWLLESAEEALSATPAEAAERVNALVRALEKLARLGGPGGGYGNSDGNVIAQRALAAWRKHE